MLRLLLMIAHVCADIFETVDLNDVLNTSLHDGSVLSSKAMNKDEDKDENEKSISKGDTSKLKEFRVRIDQKATEDKKEIIESIKKRLAQAEGDLTLTVIKPHTSTVEKDEDDREKKDPFKKKNDTDEKECSNTSKKNLNKLTDSGDVSSVVNEDEIEGLSNLSPNPQQKPPGGQQPNPQQKPTGGQQPNPQQKPTGGQQPNPQQKPTGGQQPNPQQKPQDKAKPQQKPKLPQDQKKPTQSGSESKEKQAAKDNKQRQNKPPGETVKSGEQNKMSNDKQSSAQSSKMSVPGSEKMPASKPTMQNQPQQQPMQSKSASQSSSLGSASLTGENTIIKKQNLVGSENDLNLKGESKNPYWTTVIVENEPKKVLVNVKTITVLESVLGRSVSTGTNVLYGMVNEAIRTANNEGKNKTLTILNEKGSRSIATITDTTKVAREEENDKNPIAILRKKVKKGISEDSSRKQTDETGKSADDGGKSTVSFKKKDEESVSKSIDEGKKSVSKKLEKEEKSMSKAVDETEKSILSKEKSMRKAIDETKKSISKMAEENKNSISKAIAKSSKSISKESKKADKSSKVQETSTIRPSEIVSGSEKSTRKAKEIRDKTIEGKIKRGKTIADTKSLSTASKISEKEVKSISKINEKEAKSISKVAEKFSASASKLKKQGSVSLNKQIVQTSKGSQSVSKTKALKTMSKSSVERLESISMVKASSIAKSVSKIEISSQRKSKAPKDEQVATSIKIRDIIALGKVADILASNGSVNEKKRDKANVSTKKISKEDGSSKSVVRKSASKTNTRGDSSKLPSTTINPDMIVKRKSRDTSKHAKSTKGSAKNKLETTVNDLSKIPLQSLSLHRHSSTILKLEESSIVNSVIKRIERMDKNGKNVEPGVNDLFNVIRNIPINNKEKIYVEGTFRAGTGTVSEPEYKFHGYVSNSRE